MSDVLMFNRNCDFCFGLLLDKGILVFDCNKPAFWIDLNSSKFSIFLF
jgi:hypothetical protein